MERKVDIQRKVDRHRERERERERVRRERERERARERERKIICTYVQSRQRHPQSSDL